MSDLEKAIIILVKLDGAIQIDWNFDESYLKAIVEGLTEIKEMERREKKMKVNFREKELLVVFSKYMGNDNTAIILKEDLKQESPDLIASVNGEQTLPSKIVGIKNWSENEGVVEALVKANIIKPKSVGMEPSGYVEIFHFELTEEANKERLKQEQE